MVAFFFSWEEKKLEQMSLPFSRSSLNDPLLFSHGGEKFFMIIQNVSNPFPLEVKFP